MSYNLRVEYARKFKQFGEKRSGVHDSIQVHSIGCAQNTASTIAQNMNQYSPDGIVHSIIDADASNPNNEIIQILPDDNVVWADEGYGNSHSFAIEIAESDYMKYSSGANYTITNKEKFLADVKKGYTVAVEYVADLCKKFGFDPTKKLSNGLHQVFSHNEGNQKKLSSGHVDPEHLWVKAGYSMDGFRKDVKNAMQGKHTITVNATTSASQNQVYYRVRKSWSDEKSQLGAYTILDNAKANCPVGYSVYDEKGKAVYENKAVQNSSASGTQSSDLAGMTNDAASAKLLEITKPIAIKYGLFPSVIAAQCCLESGYGHTTKLSSYNNICGMKCSLINNQWSGSTWDGVSKVTIHTPEVVNGQTIYIDDLFRVYKNLEDCISDICAFFTTLPKYVNAGIKNAKNYKEQITIESKCGYATDPNYITKICKLIEQYDLNKYDHLKTASDITQVTPPATPDKDQAATPVQTPVSSKEPAWYRVGTDWKSGACVNQIGAYASLDNAKKKADASSTKDLFYNVYDENGSVVYSTKKPFKSYMAKVNTPSLRIRKGPGTKYAVAGFINDGGVYTIVEESGSWGLLKSFQKNRDGWICLDYVVKNW